MVARLEDTKEIVGASIWEHVNMQNMQVFQVTFNPQKTSIKCTEKIAGITNIYLENVFKRMQDQDVCSI